jgi:transposase
VCSIYKRSDRMVRLWIEMFNRGGIGALATKPRSGRPPKIKRERMRDLLVPALEDPSQAVTHRHLNDIHATMRLEVNRS